MPIDQSVDTQASNDGDPGTRPALAPIKPKLRGWLHAAAFPVALVAGVLLIAWAPTAATRLAAFVYALSAVLLFGVSALYHRGVWSPKSHGILERLDHANIFLIIAGTYTPFAVSLPDERDGRTLLWVVWTGAVLGIVFRVLWLGAPRWLYTPVYVALGWVAVFYIGAIYAATGAAVVTLLFVGGGFYSAGAIVYASKRPNPWPRWFGFHEVFHACTLIAYGVHYAAVVRVISSPA